MGRSLEQIQTLGGALGLEGGTEEQTWLEMKGVASSGMAELISSRPPQLPPHRTYRSMFRRVRGQRSQFTMARDPRPGPVPGAGSGGEDEAKAWRPPGPRSPGPRPAAVSRPVIGCWAREEKVVEAPPAQSAGPSAAGQRPGASREL